MISDVTIGTALDQQSKTSGTSQKLTADFNQFLILLTTQLQNQDPLSPMDSSEFTSQLVAFSSVEQQINMNQKLDTLVSMQLGNIMGSSLSYVGLDVSYLSTEMFFDGTDPVKINYSLQGEASQTKISIIDEAGDTVFEADGSNAIGNNEFVWDGKLANGDTAASGTYNVSIGSLDIEGDAVRSTVVVTGRVRGVEAQNGLIFLLVGERAVSLGTVLNAKIPEQLAEETTEPPPELPPA